MEDPTNLKDICTDGSCFVDIERLGDPLKDWKVYVGEVSARGGRELLLAAVVLLRLLQDLGQPLSHPGLFALEGGHLSIEGGVSSEALSFHQVDLDWHHVSKVLSIRSCHIQDPSAKSICTWELWKSKLT